MHPHVRSVVPLSLVWLLACGDPTQSPGKQTQPPGPPLPAAGGICEVDGARACGQGDQLLLCDVAAGWQLVASCAPDRDCTDPGDGTASCVGPGGAASGVACDGTAPRTCDGNNRLLACTAGVWQLSSDCPLWEQICQVDTSGVAACVTPPVAIGNLCGASRVRGCAASGALLFCDAGLWALEDSCDRTDFECQESGAADAACVFIGIAPGDPCTAAQEGQSACNTGNSQILTCSGGSWSNGADCAASGLVCLEINAEEAMCEDAASLPGSPCGTSGDSTCIAAAAWLVLCTGGAWQLAVDCAAEGDTCVETVPGVAVCEPPPPTQLEGDPCVATSECVGTLVCAPAAFGDTSGALCARPCTPGAVGSCLASEYCLAIPGGGACLAKGTHGSACPGGDDTACQAPDTCIALLEASAGACTQECLPNQLGSAGSCTSGELCLVTEFWYAQPVACTPATVGVDCDTAAGYFCYDLTAYGLGFGCANPTTGTLQFLPCAVDSDCDATIAGRCLRSASEGLICAYRQPVCADLIPIWDGTLGADGMPDPSYHCGNGGRLCGVTGASGVPAYTVCQPFDNSDPTRGVCVALCELNGVPTDCGTGYACAIPPPERTLLWDLQNDGGVLCTAATAATDCSVDFPYCLQFTDGLQCARPSKVCQPG